MNLSIEADVKEVYKDLNATKIQTPSINKKMVNSAVSRGRTRTRQATYKNGIKKDSGDLRKKTISKVFRQCSDILGYIVNRSIQASNLEFGNTITSKKKPYLTFVINGQFIKVKSVTIPGGRLGFFSTLNNYFASNEPMQRMEKVLIRELNKIWGKLENA